MASVSLRLKQHLKNIKAGNNEALLEEVDQMTLAQLSKEVIQFGEAKAGITFPEAFKDHTWTDWFVGRYEKSTKIVHRKYIKYVELRLDEEIGPEMLANQQEMSKLIKNKNSKKKTSSEPSSSTPKITLPENLKVGPFSDDEEDWDQVSDAARVQDLQDQVMNVNMANQNLHQRMGHLEMAVTEILDHMKKITVKTES